jgi:hypothetical protein
MSRYYKECMKALLVYFKYIACGPVRIGIIGRLGKIFSVGLNFFGIEKGTKKQRRTDTKYLKRFGRDDH